MKNDTVLQLKALYKNAKKREEEWTNIFPEGSYQHGYAHGAVMAFQSIFENISAFENVSMFSD